MILSNTVKLKPNRKNYNHYKSLGYIFNHNDIIEVKVEDLTKGSHAIIDCTCDYCGKEMQIEYRIYKRSIDGIIKKFCCDNCRRIKTAESNMITYGVKSVSNLPDYNDKVKSTCVERYGVCNYTQTNEYKERYKNTVREKYGYDNVSQVPEIRKKKTESFYKNGTAKSSTQQRYICNVLHGELNYPIGLYNTDIYIPKDQLVIEYNGSGHWLSIKYGDLTEEEFKKKEVMRYYSIKSKNINQIFIISRHDYIPSDTKLNQMIEDAKVQLKNQHCHWVEYDIDEGLIKYSSNRNGDIYDYGKLRRIHKEVDI